MTIMMGAELSAFIQAGCQSFLPNMVPIPGGTFELPEGSTHRRLTPSNVAVSGFRMARLPVTVREWGDFKRRLGNFTWAMVKGRVLRHADYRHVNEERMSIAKLQLVALGTSQKVLERAPLRGEIRGDLAHGIRMQEVMTRSNDLEGPVAWVGVGAALLFALFHSALLPTRSQWVWGATGGGRLRYATDEGLLGVKANSFEWTLENYFVASPPFEPLDTSRIGATWHPVGDDSPRHDLWLPGGVAEDRGKQWDFFRLSPVDLMGHDIGFRLVMPTSTP